MIYQTKILVVDDERSVREMIGILLKREGHEVVTAPSGNRAIAMLEAGERYDLVVTDLAMDRGGGMDVLSQVKSRDPHCPVIMITAFGTTETAVEAMKKGAHDYIAKPFNIDEFKLIIKQALEHRNLIKENINLRAQIKGRYRFANVIGRSESMKQILEVCKKVADSNSTVFISGESGVGKEVIARAIHFGGTRASAEFVAVNCGALPEQLMESEMFGHVKGAFTGATSNKKGLFQVADGGTIFLDEIGELPAPLQVKLLRVLQERTIRPVGSSEEISVDVKTISATNQNLKELIQSNHFRTDLYYRLNVIHIEIPPLRERREDIPDLINEFIPPLIEQTGGRIKGIHPDAMRLLMEQNYPGNIRELKNILERAFALAVGDQIKVRDISPHAATQSESPGNPITKLPQDGIDLDRLLNQLERDLVDQALARTGGTQKQAAELLGISVRSLRYRLAKESTNSNSDNN